VKRPIRAVLFDVFGTVVDWRTSVAREADAFRARHGLRFDAFAFADAWRARYQPAMDAVGSGRRPFTPLDVLHRENLGPALRDVGMDPDSISEADLDELNLAWHRLDSWPDVVDGLTRLKREFIIAPLSNGNIRLMLDVAKRAGLPWDAILGAELVQAYKPMPEAYLRTARVLDLPPATVCLVAAHNGDLAAARASGFCTAFVPRPHEYGPNQTSDLEPEADWEYVARDFIDLAHQLISA
jgi:2-haloacid dehalogenase